MNWYIPSRRDTTAPSQAQTTRSPHGCNTVYPLDGTPHILSFLPCPQQSIDAAALRKPAGGAGDFGIFSSKASIIGGAAPSPYHFDALRSTTPNASMLRALNTSPSQLPPREQHGQLDLTRDYQHRRCERPFEHRTRSQKCLRRTARQFTNTRA